MPAAPLPIEEAERLAALRSYDAIDGELEAVFDDLVRLAAQLTGCPIAAVSLIDADRQVFTARCGLDVHGTPRDLAFCAHAILDPREVLIVRDASQDSRFRDNPLVTGELGIRFHALRHRLQTAGSQSRGARSPW